MFLNNERMHLKYTSHLHTCAYVYDGLVFSRYDITALSTLHVFSFVVEIFALAMGFGEDIPLPCYIGLLL